MPWRCSCHEQRHIIGNAVALLMTCLSAELPDGRSDWSIALRGPIAGASCTSRATAPSSATRGSGKPARAGRKFVLNRHRRTNGPGLRDVSLEFYEIGMGHNAVGNIDSEVIGGIACA